MSFLKTARELTHSGEYLAALRALDSSRAGTSGVAASNALRADVLEGLGRYDEANAIA